MRDRIESLFRDVLRPLFEADGGNVELVDVKGEVVVIRLGGSYRGCPSAPYTLARIVTPAVKAAAGSDVRVEVVS